LGDFENDTRVEPVICADGSGRDPGSGRYTATLVDDWAIWGPNGGYIASVALRAAGAESVFPRPATFKCQFLATGRFEAVDIEVRSVRRGRNAEALSVVMTQGERTLVNALVWTVPDAGEQTPRMEHDFAPMPDVPAARELEESRVVTKRWGGEPHRFWSNFERWSPDWHPPGEKQPRPPTYTCWHRFLPRSRFDCPFTDAARSLLLIDTNGWPAAHGPYREDQPYIAPSLDVAVQFHRSARESELLLCESEAPIATEGLIGTRGRVWDEAGRLVASGGAQLLVRPMPAMPS
jgi:acyl-CoA thioesterase-2